MRLCVGKITTSHLPSAPSCQPSYLPFVNTVFNLPPQHGENLSNVEKGGSLRGEGVSLPEKKQHLPEKKQHHTHKIKTYSVTHVKQSNTSGVLSPRKAFLIAATPVLAVLKPGPCLNFALWLFQGMMWTPSKIVNRLGKEINNPDSVYYWAYRVSGGLISLPPYSKS